MIIQQDTHAPFPRIPVILYKPTEICYNVRFTPSCRYNFGDADQDDVNKLFGIGYFPSHRHNSIRFGWNYNPRVDIIQLYAYMYINGKRSFTKVHELPIGALFGLSIRVQKHAHPLEKYTSHALYVGRTQVYWTKEIEPAALGYLMRPWFGGNRVAPHDIWIDMYKTKRWEY